MKTELKLAVFHRGALMLLPLILAFQLSPCHAAPGDLDTTFAGTGKVRIGFGGGDAVCNAVAAQSDGKLILAGSGKARSSAAAEYFLLARLSTNNALDSAFGDGGKVVTQTSPYWRSAANAVAVQFDGKIVAAGYSYQNAGYSDFALVRYNPDGSLDTTFGTNGTGMVHTDFGERSQINAMLIQDDGKIIVAGFISENGSAASGLALARYGTNGVLDPTFGNGGLTTVPWSNSGNFNGGLTFQSGGKIIVVGLDGVFRFTTNGVPDPTFGGTGEVSTPISPSGVAIQLGGITIQNPAKIVVAGSYNGLMAVARYNLDGTLDTNFGVNGVVADAIIPVSPFSQFGSAVIVQGQLRQPRKIIQAGWGTDGTNNYFALARYDASGALDSAFGTNANGRVLLSLGRAADGDAAAYAMTLQSGQFVLAGYRSLFEGRSDFAVARFTSAGVLDTTFGSNGVVLANVSDLGAQANAVAVEPDGKAVVAGSTKYHVPLQNRIQDRFALVRLNPDGSLDSSFGLNGKLTGTNLAAADAVALQPDGKIVVAGAASGQFVLARYNEDGSADGAFGNNGIATALVGTSGDQATAVRIQPDGKIIAAGYAKDDLGSTHFALARFNANGTLDISFGGGGAVITPFGSPSMDVAYSAGIQPDGKIILAGFSAQGSGSSVTSDLAVARYNTNGALDFSFGSLGRATANVGGGTLDAGYAMAIQPDGKIVVAGGAGLGGLPGPFADNPDINAYVALARFNSNGVPDTTFGNNGTVLTQVGAYSDFATALALQPDGKILVAGASQVYGLYKFFALRYNSDGSVDDSFGSHGAALVNFGTGTNELAYGLALDSSGRAVIAGGAGGPFGVARLLGDALPGIALSISLPALNTAKVSWPYPSTGWSLQENSDLSTTNWTTPVETINNDGTNNFILVNPAVDNEFYRLFKP